MAAIQPLTGSAVSHVHVAAREPIKPSSARKLTCPRYSVAKCQAYIAYSRSATRSRIAFVILATPLSSLVAVLLLPFIPLGDPARGFRHNAGGFLTHVATTAWLTQFGGSLLYRAGAQISHVAHPTSTVALASCVASALLVGFAALLSAAWRFPVPFYWVLLYVPWLAALVISHCIVTRGRLLDSQAQRRRIVSYFPAFAVQISQIVVYPAFSAAFEAASEWQQVALALLFPLVKFGLKSSIRRLAWHLEGYEEEVAVGGVEISASIYQSMIMQTTPSPLAAAAVILLDLAQGLNAVYRVHRTASPVPQHEIVATALQQLKRTERNGGAPTEQMLTSLGTARSRPAVSLASCIRSLFYRPGLHSTAVKPRSPTTKRSRENSVVLTHALEILQAAESILLVEYLEVAIPLVNTVFLTVAAQVQTAVYNQKLYRLYYHRDQLAPVLWSMLLYIALQTLSLLALAAIMRVRFCVSPSVLLAFHLERHSWSLQSKMVGWLAALLQFSVLHYGTDFRFRFDFSVPSPND